MRNAPNLKVEKHRVVAGMIGSDDSFGNNGAFEIPYKSLTLRVLCSDQHGWDHVSVSVIGIPRCPTWEEMKFVYSLFFRDDEWAVQFNPPESENVNNHEYVLHLWRNQTKEIDLPPSWMVGAKGMGLVTNEQAMAVLREINTVLGGEG